MGSGRGKQRRAQTREGVEPSFSKPEIHANGSKVWLLDGEKHRVDGPAVEYTDGGGEWWVDGERHRKDGPAVESPEGDKIWYKHGKMHCAEGPAVEWANGDKTWVVNGKLHRVDGPAVERANGDKTWWVDGEKFTEAEFDERISELRREAVQAAARTAAEEEIMADPGYRDPFGVGQ